MNDMSVVDGKCESPLNDMSVVGCACNDKELMSH